jgi:hydrogenase nickel incorporation protein HypA/HybF
VHELSVCRDVIDIVTSHLESAGGGRLRKVSIESGPHSCVNVELLRSAFQASTKDTELEGAHLDITCRTLSYRCLGCGRIGTEKSSGGILSFLTRSCPDCGSRRRQQEIDDTITIKSMEIE